MKQNILIGAVFAALIVLVVGAMSFYTVGPGERGVLLTWGKVSSGPVQPGGHFKTPFAQSVVEMNVQVRKYESKETAATKDLQNVSTGVAVNYRLIPGKVDSIYQNLGTMEQIQEKVLEPIASNSVKAVTARYNAEDLVENRNIVRQAIEKQIIAQMAQYDIDVTAVNITNFVFGHEYATAIENKQVAQQKALQAKYELDQVRTEAQQKVAKAKAQAQATLISAKADAEAMAMKNKAITSKLLQLEAIQHWNGTMPGTLVTSDKHGLLFNIPVNRTGS